MRSLLARLPMEVIRQIMINSLYFITYVEMLLVGAAYVRFVLKYRNSLIKQNLTLVAML